MSEFKYSWKVDLRKERAREAFRDQQSQDTEGGVPCGISFIAGYLNGERYQQQRIEELKDKISQMHASYDDLVIKWELQKEQLEEIHFYLPHIDKNVADSKKVLAKKDRTIIRLEAEKESLQEDVEDLEDKLQQHYDYIKELEKTIDDEHARRGKLYLENKKLQARIDELEKYKELYQNCRHVMDENKKLREYVSDLLPCYVNEMYSEEQKAFVGEIYKFLKELDNKEGE